MSKHEEIINRLFKILCSFKRQPLALRDYLDEHMTGKFYPDREVIYDRDSTVKEAIFVSDGYVACYGFDENGDRQVVSIHGKDTIIAGKSFMSQQPSAFEWVCLSGAYVLKISASHMEEVYARFEDAEELARLVMADGSEKELARLQLLKRDAETVVLDFYNNHPEFKVPGSLMIDADIASYLLISESTLRNTRAKLIRDGKL